MSETQHQARSHSLHNPGNNWLSPTCEGCFSLLVSAWWNKLPKVVRTAESFAIFWYPKQDN
uniref:Uncharacterized protein n=1 Tax=Anguilla anguilla TaxID=7936 RepID=A0A0E9QJ10_ANGAN